MDKQLLLISQGSTFMVDALSSGLKDAGINVIKCAPRVNELEQYKENPSVFLFYLGNYLEDISDALVYIKDLCVEKNKILCTIGDISERGVLTRIIPENLIMEHYYRPLDIKSIARNMLEVLFTNEALSRQKTILLVDDDPTFLTIAKGWLESEYKVIIVNSGMQAIAYLAINKPDLILLDYEMPVTPGPKVLEMIKSETFIQDVPVIFLTGKGDKESVMKVLALKPDGYLLKTLPQSELLKSLRQFFKSREQS